MTDGDWNRCDDPQPMLRYLRDRATRRKVLFFLCACYRRAWHLSAATEAGKRNLMEALELYAEGRARHEQVVTAVRPVARAEQRGSIRPLSAANWEAWVGEEVPWEEVDAGAWATRYWLACGRAARSRPNEDSWQAQSRSHKAWSAAELKERRRQAALLREVFGPLPFGDVRPDPDWLAWNGGMVAKLAQAIYEERSLPEGTLDRGRLAGLADALEEAGCVNERILSHLRQQKAVHVRGCWVIDLLLNKD
jgi:hypothetical protein